MANKRVCFFAPVSSREVLERVEFYRQDIDILRGLGLNVSIATHWQEIPWDADLYFVWWWTWAFLPLLKARVRRRPVLITGVFDHHWPVPGRDYDHRPAWQKWLLRSAVRNADANVFISKIERDSVTRELGALNSAYIPLALDTDIYWDPGHARERLVLTVAWLQKGNAERKGVPDLLRAIPLVCSKHPDVRFVIAGEHGTAYPYLLALARDLGIEHRVEFVGVISRVQKVDLMRRCKIYVQPSIYEGFGLAVLEAMGCGAAVIATPVGAIPEVLGDAGLLVDRGTPGDMAEAINRLLGDESLCGRLGQRASDRAHRSFPFERRRQELQEVILGLLESRD